MEQTTPHSVSSAVPAVPGKGTGRYSGEVVYLYAFDIADELTRLPESGLLGQPLTEFRVEAGKRSPRQLAFQRPHMVRLPPEERVGPHGAVKIERVIKLLPVGAVSIAVRVPFRVDHFEDLVVYHDLRFTEGDLYGEVRRLAEEVQREIGAHCVRPVARLADDEAYTVFCVESPLRQPDGNLVTTSAWLRGHRRAVASLLAQEADPSQLSQQEAAESTRRHLSYYQDDLVVIDWDAALVVDDRRNWEEVLYAMELANLQLSELEAYDRTLDTALERSYRDLRASGGWRGRAEVLRELREFRIDFARFSDELSNTTKFFGDWHLARIYENVCARFHLNDWQRAMESKLKTLDDLYQLLQHDQVNRWMLILEITIVLLFIIDLVLLFMGTK